MKKTIIALLALAGAALGAEETDWTQLTLNGGTGNGTAAISTTEGITSITNGQASVNWTEEIPCLTTWKTSFELTDKAIASATIWSSSRYVNDPRGMLLKVGSEGELTLSQSLSSTVFVSTDPDLIKANTPTLITLSCISTENIEGEIIGVTYNLKVSQQSVSYSLTKEQIEGQTSDDGTHNWSMFKFYDNDTTRFVTNGGNETFNKINVWSGKNKIVPEPTTATLSLLALAGLVARRRRK